MSPVWPTPPAELASALAMLHAMRFRASVLHGVGLGPEPPASIVDGSLAEAALVMARHRGPHAEHGVAMLLSQRAEAHGSPADRSDAAFLAWNERWRVYRGTCALAEAVLVEQHADPVTRSAWMERAS